MWKYIYISLVSFNLLFAQSSYQLAVLKYNGGGDWYANPSSLKNLTSFCNENHNMNIEYEYEIIELNNSELFSHPFIHMTGHGNVIFSQSEAENLRRYLIGGGFLHIDDNYGMDKFIRMEMKKVFPDLDFVLLPNSHAIYNNVYSFEYGLPKIHVHDNNPAQGLALIYNNKVICFYSYESDLSDGWENANVHNNPIHIRKKAFKMGVNIISYAFNPE